MDLISNSSSELGVKTTMLTAMSTEKEELQKCKTRAEEESGMCKVLTSTTLAAYSIM